MACFTSLNIFCGGIMDIDLKKAVLKKLLKAGLITEEEYIMAVEVLLKTTK